MGIMARTTPQFLAGNASAATCGEGFDVAVDSDSRRTLRRYKDRHIRGKALAGAKIGYLASRLCNARLTREVALFADGVSFGKWKFIRVHDVPCLRMGHMDGRVAMAALAGNSMESGKISDAIYCLRNDTGAARVAKQALGGDGAIEIRLAIVLITRRYVPDPAVRIIADRRLVQVGVDSKPIAAPHSPRADVEVQWLAMAVPFDN